LDLWTNFGLKKIAEIKPQEKTLIHTVCIQCRILCSTFPSWIMAPCHLWPNIRVYCSAQDC